MKHEEILQFQNRPFSLDIHYAKEDPRGVVLYLHGFKGFKDWGANDLVAKTFSNQRFHFVKFNFAWNGTTPGSPTEHVDLEAFGHNTYSKELDQTIQMVDWVFHHEKLKNLPIYLIGHSRGGAIAILATSLEAKVSQLATWSAVSSFEGKMFDAMAEKLNDEGVIYILNTRTNQELPIYRDIYDDYHRDKNRLSVLDRAKEIVVPTLVLHGNEDETVPVQHAVTIHNTIPNSDMAIIDDADHCFNIHEPWDKPGLSNEMLQTIDRTIEHFVENEK